MSYNTRVENCAIIDVVGYLKQDWFIYEKNPNVETDKYFLFSLDNMLPLKPLRVMETETGKWEVFDEGTKNVLDQITKVFISNEWIFNASIITRQKYLRRNFIDIHMVIPPFDKYELKISWRY